MDFNGQKNAEYLFQIIIALFGLVGWIVGFVLQDFLYTLLAVGLGTVIALASCLPDWPAYNTMDLQWQKPRPPPVDPAAKAAKSKAK